MAKHVVTAKVYDRRGTLIGQATNSYTKTHPVQDRFARSVGIDNRPFLHAEIAALLKCGTKIPHSIKVERFKKDGTPGNAAPCRICCAALKWWGVKQVSHTIG